MSDLALASFLQKLKRTIDTRKDHEDRQLAIRMLMWLCVAQRPLHPHEVLNLFADHPRVSAWIEENLGKSKPGELTTGHDYTVEPFLNILLSDTVNMIYLNSGLVVELSYAPNTANLNTQTAVLSQLRLSHTEAHRRAAEHCMKICSKGALQLVGERQYINDTSMLVYAWTYWDAHLSLAGDIARSTNAGPMVSGVAADVLSLLISISDLLKRPIRPRHTSKHIETIALIQQAQWAMERPLSLLAALVDDGSVFDTVIAVRSVLRDLKAAQAVTLADRQKASPNSEYQERAARIHGCRSNTRTRQRTPEPGPDLQDQPFLTKKHERTLQTFSETAQGLRHVCLSLAHPTLHELLLRGLDDKISPMHILAKTADLMDKITAYARCEERRSGNCSAADDSFSVLNSTGKAQLAFSLVRHYLSDHYDSEAALSCDVCKAVRISSNGTVGEPETISSVRWCAAIAITWLKEAMTPSSDNTVGSTYGELSGQPTSSFSCLPTRLYMPARDPIQYLTRFEEGTLRFIFVIVWHRLAQFYDWDRKPNLTHLIPDPGTCRFSLADAISWAQLRSALLSSGYRAALTQALAAIILYHVRRFFVPWVGAFLFHNPMDNFRLAISRPDVLLQEALSFTWTSACFSFLQRCLFDIAALIIMHVVSINNGRSPINILSRPTARQDAIMCLAKILCWFYGFVTLEYIFCRGMNTVSLVVSVAKLVMSGQDGLLALLAMCWSHPIKVPLLVLTTRYYIRHAFVPVIRGSISSAERGHASLLCAWLL